ncbi:ubiquitin-like protein atg8 [Microsporum canis]|uniref:Autophagy-related protein n=1 Tax=Arthroderma otae (strain ATCC MYA-4605 / CBS 113480) TaxID=554155 RepID=C5FBR2_ARTOC|nr:autophagy protein [Microsporum canis CBS 113480]EEQ27246.1 autophagy protein [Microsporum canis CBS 113480]
MPIPFKERFTFRQREAESARILQNNPEHIPLVCEKVPRSDIVELGKTKFLLPKDLALGQFMHVLRVRLNLPPEKAMFMFVEDEVPSNNSLLSTIYEAHKDEDGFLYMKYMGENTFGVCSKM